MQDNILFKAVRYIRDLLEYQPPKTIKPFVLKEYREQNEAVPHTASTDVADQQQLRKLLNFAEDLTSIMKAVITALSNHENLKKYAIREQLDKLQQQQSELTPVLLAYDSNTQLVKRSLSFSIKENEIVLNKLYDADINKDIVIRHFVIPGQTSATPAMLAFMDGMIDKELINLTILQPLMIFDIDKPALQQGDMINQLISQFLPSNQAQVVDTFPEVMSALNTGDTALFIDGVSKAVLIETKGYDYRSLGKPENEQSIRGAQVAFTEALRVNTGLIRTMMPTNDLVTEIFEIGDRIPNKCAVMYLKSIANPELVSEIKRRINSISTDYISDMGILEQFIEDHPYITLPQMLSTERPDRTVASLAEGRVAVLLNGTPFAHIVPVGFFAFFHSAEDFSLKTPIGSVMRLLRLVGTLLAVVLPSVYLSIIYFHPETLPTEMILAIAGARERVPFPSLGELLLMEFSFELIREAGLRIPGLLGSTIGIVGAIILGQAAVQANLVSAITVVVIAITGLASFTIPDYRMAAAGRLLRFVFIMLAAMLGLVGVAVGLLLITVLLNYMKSFGVPYMAPVSPKTTSGLDVVVRGPVFRQEMRPDELSPQDERRQPPISRKWTVEQSKQEEDEN